MKCYFRKNSKFTISWLTKVNLLTTQMLEYFSILILEIILIPWKLAIYEGDLKSSRHLAPSHYFLFPNLKNGRKLISNDDYRVWYIALYLGYGVVLNCNWNEKKFKKVFIKVLCFVCHAKNFSNHPRIFHL